MPKQDLVDLMKGTKDVRLRALAELKATSILVEFHQGAGREKKVFVNLNPNAKH